MGSPLNGSVVPTGDCLKWWPLHWGLHTVRVPLTRHRKMRAAPNNAPPHRGLPMWPFLYNGGLGLTRTPRVSPGARWVSPGTRWVSPCRESPLGAQGQSPEQLSARVPGLSPPAPGRPLPSSGRPTRTPSPPPSPPPPPPTSSAQRGLPAEEGQRLPGSPRPLRAPSRARSDAPGKAPRRSRSRR